MTFSSSTARRLTRCGDDIFQANADYAHNPATGHVYRAESQGNAPPGHSDVILMRMPNGLVEEGHGVRWQGTGIVTQSNSAEPHQNNPGFVRDANGSLIVSSNTARMFWGAGQLDTGTWDIQGGSFSTTTSGWTNLSGGGC